MKRAEYETMQIIPIWDVVDAWLYNAGGSREQSQGSAKSIREFCNETLAPKLEASGTVGLFFGKRTQEEMHLKIYLRPIGLENVLRLPVKDEINFFEKVYAPCAFSEVFVYLDTDKNSMAEKENAHIAGDFKLHVPEVVLFNANLPWGD